MNFRTNAPSKEEIFDLIRQALGDHERNDNKSGEISIPELSGIIYAQGITTGKVVIGPGVLAAGRCRIIMFTTTGGKKKVKLTEIRPLKISSCESKRDSRPEINLGKTDAMTTGTAMAT